jgi:uncharacterized membrane protein YgcG
MKTIFNLILILGLALSVRAQDEAPPPMPDTQTFSDAQLDQLMGPVALYPDPLISVLLPAATFPTQIVMADRYVNNGGDPNAIDQQGWDPSVQAIAHYPSVLQWMDNNLNWTTQVGEAFANQQQQVMGSVQRLRTDAYNLGNLQSTPQQQVVNDNGEIEILPVNPDDLYVPDYQPDQVYYQAPSGPSFIVFTTPFIVGPWMCFDFDWRAHHIVTWDHDHPRPGNWWHISPAQRNSYLARQTTVWHPENRPGFSAGFRGGDRGWNNQVNRNPNYQNINRNTNPRVQSAPVLNRPVLGVQPGAAVRPPLNTTRPPLIINHPAPAPAPQQDFRQTEQRPPDAFGGGENANDTRQFSNRGQESMQSTGHYTPPAGGGSRGSTGGGSTGGFHSSGGGGSSGGSRGGNIGGAGNNRH